MLTCMNKDVLDRFRRPLMPIGRHCRSLHVVLLNCRDDWCGLHKIGPRAKDNENFHFVISGLLNSAARFPPTEASWFRPMPSWVLGEGCFRSIIAIICSTMLRKMVSADRKSTRLNSSHGYISY